MLIPRDAHNERLASLVAGKDWRNPAPQPRYDLVVIGGGPAGLVCAAGAAGLGARVALVEKRLLGGDCLNVGCVPSKALLAAARAAAAARRASELGVETGAVSVDFAAVMERMRRLRADLAVHDSAARFSGLGVDVFFGDGRFVAPDAFEVEGARLRFSRACIATGARPSLPPIPGLDKLHALTNGTVFSLTELPRRLAVVGGGPVGCELAQAFARFGSSVTLLDVAPRLLPRDDAEAADVLAKALARDGVALRLGVDGLAGSEGGLRFQWQGEPCETPCDAVLLATGRTPNVEGLALETAGVRWNKGGIETDNLLRTTNPRVYAAGDVTARSRFTHAADFMARVVIQNALFMGRAEVSRLVIPWCTNTEPEIAGVGATAELLREQGTPFTEHRIEMAAVDRAVLDGATEGFLRVRAGRGGRILGATAVSAHAGELIGEVSLAMTHGLRMGQVARSIHPYPTFGEAFRRLGDASNRERLTPFTRKLLGLMLARFGR